MREKAKPKVWMRHIIKDKNIEMGYIQLVEYYTKGSTPHIEYEIKEEFRNQGIITRELPKYLKRCKKREHNHLLAIVESDNLISQKILEKNGFLKLLEKNDYISYIIDLNINQKDIQFILDHMRAVQTHNQKMKEMYGRD